ncbi:T9SS type A sorting domain-containing protein [Hymenobacter rigui]|uniref:T9SS C-terminal target domain-containing protein n=1 Tax=Hymenobacter rigui TaxID=334424 RepID=A0A3R9MPW3_9BACT|nr:T9SS type A sorting domain-containing protein [Hymenobacter rigui]RSK50765.1 T9SS C-terminal target domain-containing protein [Hymenobacter rigui]
MKKALRLWTSLLLAAGLVSPDVQAQRVVPSSSLPAVMPSISDLQPPTFRQLRPEIIPVQAVTTKVLDSKDAGRPNAAPTVANQTVTIGGTTGLYYIINLNVTNNGGFPITAYRFFSVPSATVAELYVYNSSSGAIKQITVAPDEELLADYNQVLIRPTANATGTTSFLWRARNSNGELSSSSATFTINVEQTPVAAALISQIVPAGAPATTLTEPLSVEPGSIAATDYVILSLPTAAQGVLALNGTAITVGQVVPAAQAAQLTFDPAAGFFGTVVFNYRARNANGTSGSSASYGIPVAKATCGQASTLNFANQPDGQNFQTTQSVLVEGVTITASNYTAPSGQTTLQVEDNQALPGKSLLWSTDYTSSSNTASSIDLSFSRPLDNFSIALADIDQVNNTWRDQVQLDGYTASGQIITLSSADVALAPNGSNNFSATNLITGQGNSNNFGPNSNVVVTFPQAIVRLRLTYRNTEPVADPGGQVIGINSLSWCSVVDVYTRFTAGPVAANVGNTVSYTVEYGNNGPDAAQQVTRTVTLPAGATNVTIPLGANYDAATRTIDFGTAASVASGSPSSFTFSFTVPSATGAYTLTANTSTPGNENGATANNTATRNLTVSDCNQVSTLDYTSATTGSRKTGTETLGGTSYTYSYAQNTVADVFSVGTDGNLSGQSLVWQLTTNTATRTATATLLFSRPVDNLTLALQDIDTGTQLTEAVQFNGYTTTTAGTAASLSTANFTLGSSVSFTSANTVQGTAAVAAGSPNGTATVRFTTPVRRLEIVFSNTNALFTASRTATIGINSLSFCAQADLATTVTPQTTPITAGTQGRFDVVFTNNGPDASNNVVRQVQLPAGLTGVTASNGGTYNATTGVVTYTSLASLANGASQNSTITFTAPANATSVTAAAVISGDASEGGNTANNSASGTVVVNPVADVTTVINGPTSLLAGQPSGTYTVSFSNTGLSSASTVAQTVTLPAGATNVVIPNGATYNATTRVIDFGTAATLAASTANAYQFSFTAPTTPGAATLRSTTSTTTGQGANTAPDQFTLALDVQAVADVAVTLTTAASPINAGTQGQFTATFTNNGPNTATSVIRQVQLPAGLTGVSLPDGGSYDAATGLVTFPTLPTLASGTSNSFQILFTAPTTGSGVTATASISTPDVELGQTANNTASATIALTPVFDLVTRITGPTTTVAGTLTTFSVITQNNGPSVAAGATQTVQLPTNLTGVYVSNNGTYDSGSGVVTFPAIATLTSGASQNNTISFLAPATGFTATASVTPTVGDSNPGNNSATAAATAVTAAPATSANLFTTITSSAASVAPGGPVTYTITQGNDGLNPAINVVTAVSLPAGLTGVTVSGGGTYNSATGVVTFPAIGTQNAGSSTSYTVTVNAPAAGNLLAGASVASGTPDPMPANNISTTNVRIAPVTDVATTLTGPAAATAGQAVTYTVTTANVGNTAAVSVQQTVQIPAGLTGVMVSGGGTYNSVTGVVTFPTIASQLPGASLTNTITYTAPAGGPLSNVASVATATAEAVTANNRSAATTSVTPVADLAVSLTGPGTVVAGNPVVYSVTTTNNGTSVAQNAVTTVQLPTGLTGVTVSGGGSYSSVTGLVTFPTIASQPAGSVTNTISFTAPTTTQLLVAANTAADNEEVTTNNSATATTTITAPTAQTVDVVTTVSANTITRTPGQPVVFTVTATNSAGSATAATNVQPVLYLPAGLTGIVLPTGATYNSTTGVVTLPTSATLAAGGAATYTVTVNAPASGSFTALAFTSADQTETDTANNSASSTITVTPQADVITTVTGPVSISPGASATYNVVTLNNGPSAAAGVQQTVQLPGGLSNVVVSGGGTYNIGSGLVTFPAIGALQPGSANAVTNTISFTAPTTAFAAIGTVTTTTAETNSGNNSSTQNTAMTNQPPTAVAVVNAQRTPVGNSAGAIPLSALQGRDADGTVSSFTITSLPTAAQGVLYYAGNPVTIGQTIPAADAALLSFDPAAGYVGNVFFTFTATDNGNVTSTAALYTVPVGQDINSVYTNSPVKGGTVATSYQNNDPIALVFDVNGGKYSSDGSVAANGLATAATNAAGTTQLSTLGLQLDAVTGLISVQDRTKLKAGTYTIQVTTTDVYGGTNTQPVTFTIGMAPLPVTLVSFTVKAVAADAQLSWRTAQEVNNDHFVVERSLNGQEFEAVQQVKGQGTTSTATAYTFTDAGIGRKASGTVYYRLRQVDADGTFSLSTVQTVAFASTVRAEVNVYPNPATNQTDTFLDLTELPTGQYTVTITDMAGRTVRSVAGAGGTRQNLEVVDLPQGTYLVQVQGQGQSFTKRLTKAE